MVNVLAVIPARGGSKAIPGKNLAKLGEYSLLERAIFAAMGSKVIDRIVVSTDSPDIAKVANQYGSFAPTLRPADLALDASTTLSVMQHVLTDQHQTFGKTYTNLILLEPTCPFRLPTHIDQAFKQMTNTSATSLMSLVEVSDAHPIRIKRVDGALNVTPYCIEEPEGLRRQDQDTAYIRNGAVYIYRTDLLWSGVQWGSNATGYIMNRDLYSIGIDEPLDLIVAKAFYRDCKDKGILNKIEWIPEAYRR
ncbi:MAG: flagellar modification protein B [Acidiferrobacteraceae bacterium]|nr:flagellar modification protein B [Acidiferrobacteraceae bacterium]